jgi:hypothetical protein
MESGALEVPPTLTVQNDLIWTVLILIGIPPVSTQIGGSAARYRTGIATRMITSQMDAARGVARRAAGICDGAWFGGPGPVRLPGSARR